MEKKAFEEYICNDISLPVSDGIQNMTDEELEKEFQKRFGEYTDNDA